MVERNYNVFELDIHNQSKQQQIQGKEKSSQVLF